MRRPAHAASVFRFGANPPPAIVFLDASVMKRAVYYRTRAVVTQRTLQWGPTEITVPETRYEGFDPNDEISNSQMRAEAKMLPRVAGLARAGRVRFQTGIEVKMEFWGLRDTRGPGAFDGIQIEEVESPLRHSRVMFTGWKGAGALQLEFFERIRSPRFLEMKKAFGALNPNAKRRRNLLADIFHIWTADAAGADFLLTLDGRLCRAAAGQPQLRLRTKVVQPSELIAHVPPPALRWRLARSLAAMGRRLKRQERSDEFFP